MAESYSVKAQLSAVDDSFIRVYKQAEAQVESFEKSTKGAMDGVDSATKSASNSVKGILTGAFKSAGTAVTSFVTDSKKLDSIKSTISTLASSIKSTLSTAWDAAKSKVSEFIASSKTLSSIVSTVETVGTGIKTKIASAFDAAKSKVSEFIASSKTLSSIVSTVQTVGSGIKAGITSAFDAAKSKVSEFIASSKTLSSIASTAQTVGASIKSHFATGVDGAKGVLGTLGNVAKTAFSGVSSAASAVWGPIKNGFTQLGGEIKSALSGAIDTIKKKFSELKANAMDALGGIGQKLAITGGLITAFGVKSLKSFGDFESSLNKAAVMAGGTSNDIAGLSKVANKMGADLPLSAQESADAMVQMAQSGASVKTIEKTFPAIAKASTAAGSDLTETAKAVQVAMTIWRDSLKSPEEAASGLVKNANLSNASVEQMSNALANVGGTAVQAGLSFNQVLTAVGLLTNNGFSAAQASQDLNHGLLQMVAPGKTATEAMDKLGISYTDANGKMKPFSSILEDLRKKFQNMTPAQQAMYSKMLFQTSGMQAMLPLIKSTGVSADHTATSWSGFASALQKSDGSVKASTKSLNEQSKDMQNNVGSSIEQVGGNWEALRNTAMEATKGVHSSYLSLINDALSWATYSKSGSAGFIRTFIGMSPVIGAATVAFGGFLTAVARIGSTLQTLASAAIGLLSPVTLVAAGFTALVAGFVLAYKNSATLRGAIAQIGQAFTSVFGSGISSAKSALSGFVSAIKPVTAALGNELGGALKSINWNGVFTVAKTAITTFGTVAKTVFTVVGNAVRAMVTVFGQIASGFAQTGAAAAVWTAIQATITAVWTVLKSVVTTITNFITQSATAGSTSSTIWTTIGTVIGTVVTFISNVVTAIMNFITQTQTAGTTANAIWTAITTVVGSVVNVFVQIVSAIAQVVAGFVQTGAASATWNAIVAVAKLVWQAIKDIAAVIGAVILIVAKLVGGFLALTPVQALFRVIGVVIGALVTVIMSVITIVAKLFTAILDPVGTVKSVWRALSSFFSGLWKGIKSVASSAWNGIKGMLSATWNTIKGVATSVFNALKSFFSGVWHGIKSVASSAWNGIKGALSAIWNGIKAVATSVFNALKSFFSGVWQGIKSVTSSVWSGIKGMLSAAWNTIKGVAISVFRGIKSFISGIWNGIRSVTSIVWNGIKNVVGSLARSAASALRAAWRGLTGFASSIFNGIKNTILRILGAGLNLYNIGRNIILGLWNGMGSVAQKLMNWVSNLANNIVKTISKALHIGSPSKVMHKIGMFTVQGLAQGIRDNTSLVTDQANKLAAAATPKITPNYQMGSLSAGIKPLANGKIDITMDQNQIQPAYVTLQMGGHTFSTFVDDISKQQGTAARLNSQRL